MVRNELVFLNLKQNLRDKQIETYKVYKFRKIPFKMQVMKLV